MARRKQYDGGDRPSGRGQSPVRTTKARSGQVRLGSSPLAELKPSGRTGKIGNAGLPKRSIDDDRKKIDDQQIRVRRLRNAPSGKARTGRRKQVAPIAVKTGKGQFGVQIRLRLKDVSYRKTDGGQFGFSIARSARWPKS